MLFFASACVLYSVIVFSLLGSCFVVRGSYCHRWARSSSRVLNGSVAAQAHVVGKPAPFEGGVSATWNIS